LGAFTRWCRLKGTDPPALSVSTIELRLSDLGWNYTQRFTLDRKDRHIASVMAKGGNQRDDILAMIAVLPYDLRGLRDRASLTAAVGSTFWTRARF